MLADANQQLTSIEAAELPSLQSGTLSAWPEDGSQPGLAFFTRQSGPPSLGRPHRVHRNA
jgi:hypothetical protein